MLEYLSVRVEPHYRFEPGMQQAVLTMRTTVEYNGLKYHVERVMHEAELHSRLDQMFDYTKREILARIHETGADADRAVTITTYDCGCQVRFDPASGMVTLRCPAHGGRPPFDT